MQILTVLVSIGFGIIIGFAVCAMLGANRNSLFWELLYLTKKVVFYKEWNAGENFENTKRLKQLIDEIDPEGTGVSDG